MNKRHQSSGAASTIALISSAVKIRESRGSHRTPLPAKGLSTRKPSTLARFHMARSVRTTLSIVAGL